MEINQELISSLHTRIEEYCRQKYGITPTYIRLDEDGITAVEEYGCCGEIDRDYYTIPLDELNENLEVLAAKWKAEEEKRKLEEEKKRKEREREYEKQQKEQRKREYLKLKKEFEG